MSKPKIRLAERQKPKIRLAERHIVLPRLLIPISSGEISIAHEIFGPDLYNSVEEQISAQDLNVADFMQTAYCVYAGLSNQRSEIPEVRKFAEGVTGKMRDLWFRSSTFVYHPEEGVLAVDDIPENERKTLRQLVERLGKTEDRGVVWSDDGSVRLAKVGYKIGEMTPSQLAKNRGIAALCGNWETPETVAKIAEHYKEQKGFNPHFGSYTQTQGDRKFYSGLGFVGCGLCVGGVWVGSGSGCAFGVDKKQAKPVRTRGR